jgi:hypothetical protein
MRTEYKLYHWPAIERGSYVEHGQFKSLQDAVDTAGFSALSDWRLIDDRYFLRLENLSIDETELAGGLWVISEIKVAESDTDGQIDGAHHKTWVIDQVVRILAGDNYDSFIDEFCKEEDGFYVYRWSKGIAP